jgi:REP element-mobilizing transposase RayT
LEVVRSMQRELESLPPDRQDAERRKRIEELLDRGHGCCALRDPHMARCVVDTWKRFEPERYELLAWVVMPNHVHVMVHVRQGWELGRILQSWKSFTGRRLKAEHGVGWLREYWDRYIRDERHFASAVAYIHNNPVKARLVARPEDWPWSSAGTTGPQLDVDITGAELGLGALREAPE